jgi:hypothetical protein
MDDMMCALARSCAMVLIGRPNNARLSARRHFCRGSNGSAGTEHPVVHRREGEHCIGRPRERFTAYWNRTTPSIFIAAKGILLFDRRYISFVAGWILILFAVAQ